MNLARYSPDISLKQRANALRPLLALIAEGEPLSQYDKLQLKIVFKSEDVNLRELAAYLLLIDRCYGRSISENGLATYSHRRSEQLVARTLRAGSIETELVELALSPNGLALTALWLLLKYMPPVIKALPEGAKQLAEAYNAYEDGRLKRENRRQLRNQIKNDPTVGSLEKPAQEKLIPLLENLLERDTHLFNAAGRFSDEYVKYLELKVLRNRDEG